MLKKIPFTVFRIAWAWHLRGLILAWAWLLHGLILAWPGALHGSDACMGLAPCTGLIPVWAWRTLHGPNTCGRNGSG